MAAGKHKTEGTLATLFLLNISAFIILFAWFKTKLQELYKKKNKNKNPTTYLQPDSEIIKILLSLQTPNFFF